MRRLSENWMAFALGMTLTILVTLFAVVVGILYQDAIYKHRIYPSVYIDGIAQNGKTLEELETNYVRFNKALKDMQIEIVYADEPVATYSGEMIQLTTNGQSRAKNAYAITRSGDALSDFWTKAMLLLRIKRYSFTTNTQFDADQIFETIAIVEKQYSREAKNALFAIDSGKVTAFAQEKDGFAIHAKAAQDATRTLLSFDTLKELYPFGESLRIVINGTVVKPSVTLAEANTYGIQEIIGEGSSDYSGSIPGRVHNVLLSTEKLNGTLIPKGELFSFNKTIGDISGATGYKPAYIILNGRTVLGDGGGVCQASTTIFRAAIASGLPIMHWAPHAYRVHYYENDGKPGRDATVYSPTQDFSFRNDTPAAILIQTEVDTEQNTLRYILWGKKDGRVAEISDVGMSNAVPAPPAREEEDPTLPRGERRQVDWAASGLTTWFDYKVVRGPELIQEKRFVSNYRPWQAVYLVGTKD
ncbi:MAG TPA: VanW family protein [Candidatus Woesebacteria bacterium]|nr:VanW family protein [Candidatus Woesebacteria bacterium]HNS94645.1 VanW family protein [Candidatus Woesebacteria bacterium]